VAAVGFQMANRLLDWISDPRFGNAAIVLFRLSGRLLEQKDSDEIAD
jgi:hypothetical protein